MSTPIKTEQDDTLRNRDSIPARTVKPEPNDSIENTSNQNQISPDATTTDPPHSTLLGNSYSQSSSTYGISFPINGNPPNGTNTTTPSPSAQRTPNQHQNQHQNQPRPLQPGPKYAKIQPAIAPKPVSVLPKPSTFSPIPSIKSGKAIQLHTSASESSVNSNSSLNINTSRRWVLPPRPRPGRKPTSGGEEEIKKVKTKPSTSIAQSNSTDAVNDTKNGTSPKKRAKISKTIIKQEPTSMHESSSSPAILEQSNLSTIIEDKKIDIAAISSLSPPSSAEHRSSPPPPPPVTKSTDPRTEINELKVSYLTKLKEQELIRNYIEVITNQIKELSFVQNGVITVDALKTTPTNSLRIRKNNGGIPVTTNTGVGITNGTGVNSGSSSGSSTSSGTTITSSNRATSYDQLESINNLNDLNKFLGYLTKSSNLIHSATKQKKGPEDADSAVNNQIHHFLDIRAKFKSMKLEEAKKADNLKAEWKRSIQKIGIEKNQPEPKPSSILSSRPPTSSPTTTNTQASIFTTDLLRMKGSNMFSDNDHDFMIEMLDDDYSQGISQDLAMDDGDFLSIAGAKEAEIDPNGLEIEEEQHLGNVKIHDKNELVTPKVIKKKSKLNCGFCTNDTPCLCLDADIDLI